MDIQPSVESNLPYDPNSISRLDFAVVCMPHTEFATHMTIYPGTQTWPPFGDKGHFFLSLGLHRGGKKLGEYHTQCVDEMGIIEIDIADLLKTYNAGDDSIIMVEYHHAKDVPVELYFSHTHLASKAYVSYPGLAFMGDDIFINVHAEQLENTIFWPGLMLQEGFGASAVVVNPFKLPLHYQLSLYMPDGERLQSKVFKARPFRYQRHNIEELFPEAIEVIKADGGRCSLCIAAQYKLVAYYMISDKKSGAITTLDHFHSYCMY